MRELRERILSEGSVLPGGILKVDAFLNHQLDPAFTLALGRAFRDAFETTGVTRIDKVVTAEVSGIAPALAAAVALGVPAVYARKKRPVTMAGRVLTALAPSATKGGETALLISPDFLGRDERVVLIDDFLASGRTVRALAQLVEMAGAQLVGAGFVIEKSFDGGRKLLAGLDVPLVSLAVVAALDEQGIRLIE